MIMIGPRNPTPATTQRLRDPLQIITDEFDLPTRTTLKTIITMMPPKFHCDVIIGRNKINCDYPRLDAPPPPPPPPSRYDLRPIASP